MNYAEALGSVVVQNAVSLFVFYLTSKVLSFCVSVNYCFISN